MTYLEAELFRDLPLIKLNVFFEDTLLKFLKILNLN